MFDPLAFEGTAEYYAAGRAPYSAELGESMRRELGLDGSGLLLDVGCGPGVLVLALAGLFARVVALDPESGMLALGEWRAAEAGIANVRWVQGVADDLPMLGLGPCRVVTFGQSFHRVSRREVAESVYDLLEPGGSMVLITHYFEDQAGGIHRSGSQPVNPGYPEVPHAAVRELIFRYRGEEARRALEHWNDGWPDRFEDTLAETRFGGSRTIYAPGRPDLVRDVDAVVANYFSMSYAAPRVFGDRLSDFEADLRRLLLEHSPAGRFWEWPGDTELVIATKRRSRQRPTNSRTPVPKRS